MIRYAEKVSQLSAFLLVFRTPLRERSDGLNLREKFSGHQRFLLCTLAQSISIEIESVHNLAHVHFVKRLESGIFYIG